VGVNRFLFAGRNCDIENTNCVILEKDPVVGRQPEQRQASLATDRSNSPVLELLAQARQEADLKRLR